MPSDGRSFVTGYFALDLDGLRCGPVQKVAGGEIQGAPPLLPGSHVRYSDVEVQVDLAMGQPVKDWIDASLALNDQRKSGKIKAADFKREVRHIREFHDALLTEIGFPACDGAAKDAALVSLKFSPGTVRDRNGDGSTLEAPADAPQVTAHRSDFRLTIAGLETACAKVQKVDAITVKREVAGADRGQGHGGRPAESKLDVSNLTVTISEGHAQPFRDWYDDFAVKGHNAPDQRRSGSLVYLNRTRQKALLTLTFSGLGISGVSAAPRANNEDRIASMTVEMSCESVRAKFA